MDIKQCANDPYIASEIDGIRKQQILDAWKELSEWEACEAFDEMGLDPDEIKEVCGNSAYRAYTNWFNWAVK